MTSSAGFLITKDKPARWREWLRETVATLKEERGAVESGLTLIPLTILFLVTAQLLFATQWGNAQHIDQQGEANQIGITGRDLASDSERSIGSAGKSRGQVRYEPLIGGGYLVISERRTRVPFLAHVPGLDPEIFHYRNQVAAVSEVFTR